MDVWRDPGGPLPWRRDAVHVWLAMWPEDAPACSGVLTAAERERAARFLFERDRARFIRSHTALRVILSGYTGIAPELVPLRTAGGGKPELDLGMDGGWRFNLSHSGSAALVAVAYGREVGADIERIRHMEDGRGIASRFFAAGECTALEAVPAEIYDQAFFACWTRKEAFIKATGEGLGRGLGSFAVPVDPAGVGPWAVEGWSVKALAAPAGYACAVAVEGDAGTVCCWRFRDWPGMDVP